MARLKTSRTGTLDVQPRIGGDLAFLRGVAKAVLEADGAVDQAFVDKHTTGFEGYRRLCADTPWDELARQSGVEEQAMRNVAELYAAAAGVPAGTAGAPLTKST